MPELGQLRDNVNQVHRKLIGLEVAAQRLLEEADRSKEALREAGIDPEKDIDAQIAALNAAAFKAVDHAVSIVEELDALL